MQERVGLVNGTITSESKPMGGTTIHVRVPLESWQALQGAGGVGIPRPRRSVTVRTAPALRFPGAYLCEKAGREIIDKLPLRQHRPSGTAVSGHHADKIP
jgi:hypothetical protein